MLRIAALLLATTACVTAQQKPLVTATPTPDTAPLPAPPPPEPADTSIPVDAAALDAALRDANAAMASARITAAYDKGAPIGFKLASVQAGGPLDRAGFEGGDVVTRVAGVDLRDLASINTAWARLTTAERFDVVLRRDDREIVRQYRVIGARSEIGPAPSLNVAERATATGITWLPACAAIAELETLRGKPFQRDGCLPCDIDVEAVPPQVPDNRAAMLRTALETAGFRVEGESIRFGTLREQKKLRTLDVRDSSVFEAVRVANRQGIGPYYVQGDAARARLDYASREPLAPSALEQEFERALDAAQVKVTPEPCEKRLTLKPGVVLPPPGKMPGQQAR